MGATAHEPFPWDVVRTESLALPLLGLVKRDRDHRDARAYVVMEVCEQWGEACACWAPASTEEEQHDWAVSGWQAG
jgi:hypothetical protein